MTSYENFWESKSLASYLKVSEQTIRRWIREDKLSPAFFIGNKYLVPEEALQAFLRNQEEEKSKAGKPRIRYRNRK